MKQSKRVSDDGMVIIRQNITISPASWSIATAARLIEVATKLARLSLSVETERITITQEALRMMSDEEFAALANEHGVDL